MKKIIVLGLLFASSSVSAGYGCSGTVKNVLVYGNGKVNVRTSYRGDYTVMCSLKNDWKGLSPEACKGMLSTLLTAQSTGKKLRLITHRIHVKLYLTMAQLLAQFMWALLTIKSKRLN
ncbi:hypothetical protein [Vibrio hepatarius]|uniref:hypothetical protein n=1 Tax=Vibrio hepatarius TaxID=171383 RepID=UPI001C08522A|nr:hypothetical protein [Vibrio hepatarius]MBU2898416.1 hypothetical protein [Vibrio hepatarius]